MLRIKICPLLGRRGYDSGPEQVSPPAKEGTNIFKTCFKNIRGWLLVHNTGPSTHWFFVLQRCGIEYRKVQVSDTTMTGKVPSAGFQNLTIIRLNDAFFL